MRLEIGKGESDMIFILAKSILNFALVDNLGEMFFQVVSPPKYYSATDPTRELCNLAP